MGLKEDGLRLIKEFDMKYDNNMVSREVWITQVKAAVEWIRRDDEDLADRITSARGLDCE